MDRLFWYVFAGSRGGPTRARIMETLLQEPMNTNQLARALELDYKTVEYQLRVLGKHMYVVADRERYGRCWRPSRNLLAAEEAFAALAAQDRREWGVTTGTSPKSRQEE